MLHSEESYLRNPRMTLLRSILWEGGGGGGTLYKGTV